ncbi:MAG: hypothetical protein QY318_00365 [Candidatus Dojkabacteria bacterium]|nr:MAG: hypothetical protein QY318_00365 [Candidatus Dojkabacteria bacterium]
MMNKYKRAIRNLFTSHRAKRSFSKDSILFAAAGVAVVAFILTQLVTNSILSPLGHTLQSLNEEKNQLVEVNREVEREIASNVALSVVDTYAKEKFNLSDDSDSETIYITDDSIQASR